MAWPEEDSHCRMESTPRLGASVFGTTSEVCFQGIVGGSQWVFATAPRHINFTSAGLSGLEAGSGGLELLILAWLRCFVAVKSFDGILF